MKKQTHNVSECDIIKIKMIQDPSDANSETYKLKIATFENVKLEAFLALTKNFKTAIDGAGTISAAGKINYLRTLLCGDALQEFDKLEIHNTVTKNKHLILIQEILLGTFF